MIQRSIVLFPDILSEKVESIREKHDPLFGKIKPHITLVFPFESRLSSESLRKHVSKAVQGIMPFSISLQDVVSYEGKYIFFLVGKGKEQVKELHDKLYSDDLEEFLSLSIPYLPHITLGTFQDKEKIQSVLHEVKQVLSPCEADIREIIIERIDENGKSHVESIIPLQVQ